MPGAGVTPGRPWVVLSPHRPLQCGLCAGIPWEWNGLTITSLHKKGDKADPANYHGIAVMSALPKLLAGILLACLELVSEAKQLQATT